MDYRDIPGGRGAYTKIVSLEMAEVSENTMLVESITSRLSDCFRQHVGIRRYGAFLGQVYDLLDDDGVFVLQVAGIRPSWQFEDLIW